MAGSESAGPDGDREREEWESELVRRGGGANGAGVDEDRWARSRYRAGPFGTRSGCSPTGRADGQRRRGVLVTSVCNPCRPGSVKAGHKGKHADASLASTVVRPSVGGGRAEPFFFFADARVGRMHTPACWAHVIVPAPTPIPTFAEVEGFLRNAFSAMEATVRWTDGAPQHARGGIPVS